MVKSPVCPHQPNDHVADTIENLINRGARQPCSSSDVYAVPASLTQETVYKWWPIAGGISIAGALLGAIFPGWKAVKQDVIQALSYE
jgi:hypothetical protein